MAAVAAIGVLAATFYALRFVQRVFQGPNSHAWQLPDLAVREGVILSAMMALLLWFLASTRNPCFDLLPRL